MRYREVVNLKKELSDLRYRLAVLAGIDSPTKDNLAEVEAIEARAHSIENYIRMRAKQYGFYAGV